MSPEIKINSKVVASVPDETGIYKALDGSPLRVDSDEIEAKQNWQALVLEGPLVGGLRIIGLTQQGIGYSYDRKRGDGKLPELEVLLQDRPIRVTYKRCKEIERYTFAAPHTSRVRYRKTYYNPRWIRR